MSSPAWTFKPDLSTEPEQEQLRKLAEEKKKLSKTTQAAFKFKPTAAELSPVERQRIANDVLDRFKTNVCNLQKNSGSVKSGKYKHLLLNSLVKEVSSSHDYESDPRFNGFKTQTSKSTN